MVVRVCVCPTKDCCFAKEKKRQLSAVRCNRNDRRRKREKATRTSNMEKTLRVKVNRTTTTLEKKKKTATQKSLFFLHFMILEPFPLPYPFLLSKEKKKERNHKSTVELCFLRLNVKTESSLPTNNFECDEESTSPSCIPFHFYFAHKLSLATNIKRNNGA